MHDRVLAATAWVSHAETITTAQFFVDERQVGSIRV